MNVLGLLPMYVPYSRVGAWITTHEYLAGLARRGHTVTVVTNIQTEGPYEIDGVHVQPNRGDVSPADVVVTHLGVFPHVAHFASSLGVPVVRMVHGHDEQNRVLLDVGTNLAVFASQALADDTGWNGPQLVAHPPVRPDEYRVKPGKHVTLANLSQKKGGGLLGWIADANPDVEFLGVLGWGFQYEQQPANVRVIDPVADMRTVYRQTRVLLVPSVQESYGRVAVEAACSGIPTIAHPSPGLVEAMGDAALWIDRADRQRWIDTVGTLMRDKDFWTERSRIARHAIQADPDATVDHVGDEIEELTRLGARI